ncbi:hypothetical protein AAMO2058_000487500 [Amorphochlora amoebiformis]
MADAFVQWLTHLKPSTVISLALTIVVVMAWLYMFISNRMALSYPQSGSVWKLEGRGLSTRDFATIGRELSKANPHRIDELNMRANSMTPDGAKAFLHEIPSLPPLLKTLDLGQNRLANTGSIAIADYVARVEKGHVDALRLILDDNSVGSFGGEAIFKAVFLANEKKKAASGRVIGVLNMGNNNLGQEGIVALSNAIEHRNSEAYLDGLIISKNDFGADSAKRLFSALSKCGGVRSLDLSENRLGDTGAEALASEIKKKGFSWDLASVKMRGCNISDKGASSLLKALEACQCTSLTHLDLGENEISGEILEQIQDSVEWREGPVEKILGFYNESKNDLAPSEKICLYEILVDKGSVDGFNLLAEAYLNGEGVEKDTKRAFDLYTQSAAKDSSMAMACLAHCYLAGDGVQKDDLKAVELFRRAASLNEPDSIYNLGLCYLKGIGVREPNKDKALSLFKRAAELGQPLAKRFLARFKKA